MKLGKRVLSVRTFITYKQLRQSYIFNNMMMNKDDLRNHSIDEPPRPLSDESLNDLMGKIAEFGVYNRFIYDGIQCDNAPSIKDYGPGESDPGYDLIIRNYRTIDGIRRDKSTIDVKSSKLFAGSMILPYLKYQVTGSGKVIYLDNENSKNPEIPNLFIAVNVGQKGLKSSEYKYSFNKIVYNICHENKNKGANDKVPSNKLTLKIKGVLDDTDVANCVRKGTNLFYGTYYYDKSGKHYDEARGEYIPTSKYKSKLRKDNYVFPYWYVSDLNPRNTKRVVKRMRPVYF